MKTRNTERNMRYCVLVNKSIVNHETECLFAILTIMFGTTLKTEIHNSFKNQGHDCFRYLRFGEQRCNTATHFPPSQIVFIELQNKNRKNRVKVR